MRFLEVIKFSEHYFFGDCTDCISNVHDFRFLKKLPNNLVIQYHTLPKNYNKKKESI